MRARDPHFGYKQQAPRNTISGSDTIDSSVTATALIAANFTDTLNGIAGDTVDLAGGDIFTSATGGLRAYLTGHNVFTGSGDTAYLLTPSQGNTINGNDTIDAEAAGTVAIGINDTDTLTGVSGDVVDLAGGDIFTSTTGGLSAYLTGHNVFTGSGDTGEQRQGGGDIGGARVHPHQQQGGERSRTTRRPQAHSARRQRRRRRTVRRTAWLQEVIRPDHGAPHMRGGRPVEAQALLGLAEMAANDVGEPLGVGGGRVVEKIRVV